uniref:Uncharacterized protein n=1 Tax=Glossina austeni TaxID=7395 RepID=A0A1A9UHA8_GLOAU
MRVSKAWKVLTELIDALNKLLAQINKIGHSMKTGIELSQLLDSKLNSITENEMALNKRNPRFKFDDMTFNYDGDELLDKLRSRNSILNGRKLRIVRSYVATKQGKAHHTAAVETDCALLPRMMAEGKLFMLREMSDIARCGFNKCCEISGYDVAHHCSTYTGRGGGIAFCIHQNLTEIFCRMVCRGYCVPPRQFAGTTFRALPVLMASNQQLITMMAYNIYNGWHIRSGYKRI